MATQIVLRHTSDEKSLIHVSITPRRGANLDKAITDRLAKFETTFDKAEFPGNNLSDILDIVGQLRSNRARLSSSRSYHV